LGPFVIGHRGASAELPENTMPAFVRALSYAGIAGIETDLHLSKDGVVVLIHDDVLAFPSQHTNNNNNNNNNYIIITIIS
jgi:glycerophosphoryl diester phosphodiesterase